LASTPVDPDLKAGHLCSQLQALPEAGLGMTQTVRNEDSKPVQRVPGGWGGLQLWGSGETLAPAQSWRKTDWRLRVSLPVACLLCDNVEFDLSS